MNEIPWDFVKKEVVCQTANEAISWELTVLKAAGTELESFSSRLLRNAKDETEEDYIKWLAAGILVGKCSPPLSAVTQSNTYLGGTDTSYGTILSFYLAMVHNPDVQAKAQAEIDAVVGHGRLPNFDDRPHLPYVEAIVKEIYRTFVVGPLGIPHKSNADDVHDGHFIPKGSIIFTNIW